MRLIEEVEESVRRSSEEFEQQQRINETVSAMASAANGRTATTLEADSHDDIRVRGVTFDDDPIEKCVKCLIDMGYTEMGTDRLRMVAELCGGRVEDAVDMVEEERGAWKTFITS